ALIGNSEGGMMAAYFAATYPERVSHLILTAAGPKYATSPDYPYAWPVEILRNGAENWPDGSVFRLILPSLAKHPAFPALAAKIERQSCSPGNYRALIELNIKLDIRPVLSQIKVPTLVLHRTQDFIVRVEEGRWYAEHIPGAKMIEYPHGLDHFVIAD